MTALSDQLEALAKAVTQGEWKVRDHCVSPQHGLDRVKLSNQRGPLGSFDRLDSHLIVLLHNNLETIIKALRSQGL